jgi:hypothetical protein
MFERSIMLELSPVLERSMLSRHVGESTMWNVHHVGEV